MTKPLPGYGELFRMLSYAEIGPACVLSRALGGLMGKLVILVMPGSRAAVELAMRKIILPELAPHRFRIAEGVSGIFVREQPANLACRRRQAPGGACSGARELRSCTIRISRIRRVLLVADLFALLEQIEKAIFVLAVNFEAIQLSFQLVGA